MRNSFKKILSFLLVIGIMAGSFVFAMPALADSGVVLMTNGGTLADTTPIEAGAKLPTYEGITRGDLAFGGWFTNADFTGTQSFVAAANTTYYARWVDPTVLQNFDSWDPATYASSTATYKYHAGTTAATTLNTESAHAFSGNNSAHVYNVDWSANSDQCFHIEDDYYGAGLANVTTGYYFWVEASVDVKISIYIPWGIAYTYTIPAGTKQLITANKKTAYGDNFRIIFHKALTSKAKVWIDDIGTFTDVPYVSQTPVTLNTNGGTLANPNAEYFAEDTLPTDITKENALFLGWYENADLTGTPVTTAKNDGVYYAKWLENYAVVDDFESYGSIDGTWYKLDYASCNAVDTLSLNTDVAGNKSLKVVANNIKSVSGDAQWGSVCFNKAMDPSITSEGIYFFVDAKYELAIRLVLNVKSENNKIWGSNSVTRNIAIGANHVVIPWSDFGAGIDHSDVTSLGFSIKGRWSNDGTSKGELYIDNVGVYGAKVAPSFGMATSGNVALFAPGDSENAGIVGGTAGSAVYKIDDVEYTAFRVFGTYVAPDNNGAPDFGKVVVAVGDVRDIVSRHIMLGYNKAPTIENNYVMTTATADFDKCWGYVQNDDGSWTVTYSLLLKNIPEEYVETAFNVKSAIVTAAGTIVSNEMTEGVSAKAIYDAIPGEKPGWFTPAPQDYAIYFDNTSANASGDGSFWFEALGMSDIGLTAGNTYTVEFDMYALTAGGSLVFGGVKDLFNTDAAIVLPENASPKYGIWLSVPENLNEWKHYSLSITTKDTMNTILFHTIGSGFKGYIDNVTIKDSNGAVVAKFPTAEALGGTSNGATVVALPDEIPSVPNYALYVDNRGNDIQSDAVWFNNLGTSRMSFAPGKNYTLKFDSYTLTESTGGFCYEGVHSTGGGITGFNWFNTNDVLNGWAEQSVEFTFEGEQNLAHHTLRIGAGFEGYLDNFRLYDGETLVCTVEFDKSNLDKSSSVGTVVVLPDGVAR